jgi:hypothetical protein
MVTEGGAVLYTDPRKVAPEVAAHLKEGGVEVGEGAQIYDCCRASRSTSRVEPQSTVRLVLPLTSRHSSLHPSMTHPSSGSPL